MLIIRGSNKLELWHISNNHKRRHVPFKLYINTRHACVSNPFSVTCIAFVWFAKYWATSINESRNYHLLSIMDLNALIKSKYVVMKWGLSISFNTKLWNYHVLLVHVITSQSSPMFLCLRKFHFLHKLKYNSQISLFVLLVCESACLNFRNHKKRLWLDVLTIS